MAFKENRILTLPSVYISNYLKHVHKNKQKYNVNSEFHLHNRRNMNRNSIIYYRRHTTQHCINYWGSKVYLKLDKIVNRMRLNKFFHHTKKYLNENSFYNVNEVLSWRYKISIVPIYVLVCRFMYLKLGYVLI